MLTVVIRETIFGNIWRSINFNPYQLCPKPRNPSDTYYGTLPRVLALRPPLLLKRFEISLKPVWNQYHITVWTILWILKWINSHPRQGLAGCSKNSETVLLIQKSVSTPRPRLFSLSDSALSKPSHPKCAFQTLNNLKHKTGNFKNFSQSYPWNWINITPPNLK